jgi:hypothetical protein
MGSVLTLAVALLSVGERFNISPSQTGLVLTYIITVQQTFSWLVRQVSFEIFTSSKTMADGLVQIAEVENDMVRCIMRGTWINSSF